MSDTYDLDAGPDPAVLAASKSEPESLSAKNPVYTVGIGPGNLEYLTPRSERAICDADVIVGFKTVVEFIKEKTNADLLSCGYRDEAETLATFADRVADGKSGTAVLMGDPNHSGYQFVGKVQDAVEPPVRVIPGISSLQVAASRARTPMEESVFVTLHKSGNITSDLRLLRDKVGEQNLLVLPRPYDWMPEDIAAALLSLGASPSLEALVLEHLTHDEEKVTNTTLGKLRTLAEKSDKDNSLFSDLSILAVRSA